MKSADKMVILYEGPVRDLCPLAPNNVNTMATDLLFTLFVDGFIAAHVYLKKAKVNVT